MKDYEAENDSKGKISKPENQSEINPSNTKQEKKVDAHYPLLQYIGLFFDKFIMLQLILKHGVFNEEEAAMYCRCSIECIRYHALRSRKLTCLRITKEGLVFLKTDLDKFLENARQEGFRDY